MPVEGKVAKCRLCVVKDERLAPDTPTYRYPFSNVSAGGSICVLIPDGKTLGDFIKGGKA